MVVKVHFIKYGRRPYECPVPKRVDVEATGVLDKVTCRSCRRSAAFERAMAEQRAIPSWVEDAPSLPAHVGFAPRRRPDSAWHLRYRRHWLHHWKNEPSVRNVGLALRRAAQVPWHEAESWIQEACELGHNLHDATDVYRWRRERHHSGAMKNADENVVLCELAMYSAKLYELLPEMQDEATIGKLVRQLSDAQVVLDMKLRCLRTEDPALQGQLDEMVEQMQKETP